MDGVITWTEHNVPYQFNDDGNLLIPWVLPPGSHQLEIKAVTASGAFATTQARITTTRAPVPAALRGKVFIRSMPYRVPDASGRLALHLQRPMA